MDNFSESFNELLVNGLSVKDFVSLTKESQAKTLSYIRNDELLALINDNMYKPFVQSVNSALPNERLKELSLIAHIYFSDDFLINTKSTFIKLMFDLLVREEIQWESDIIL
ncbi:hypothetical protein P5G65_25150 [Paenibacillus chondroitinus]|uniref:Uncharacterized protein n=1 Tax=Paenibacillus chondroitinus TaxID=59842 RepID=A0ABU6DIQ3_9BACL|nr:MULTISPECIES: hypothetical protein [Paenibacillus]MCY9658485.1 hypothetical protein [Paenibacillus anseongense]MEB4797197.1 hypothetical protein [Paenibacillus chondroitinus]